MYVPFKPHMRVLEWAWTWLPFTLQRRQPQHIVATIPIMLSLPANSRGLVVGKPSKLRLLPILILLPHKSGTGGSPFRPHGCRGGNGCCSANPEFSVYLLSKGSSRAATTQRIYSGKVPMFSKLFSKKQSWSFQGIALSRPTSRVFAMRSPIPGYCVVYCFLEIYVCL